MKRRVFAILSAVSLLLALVTAFLWVRTNWLEEQVCLTGPGTYYWRFCSSGQQSGSKLVLIAATGWPAWGRVPLYSAAPIWAELPAEFCYVVLHPDDVDVGGRHFAYQRSTGGVCFGPDGKAWSFAWGARGLGPAGMVPQRVELAYRSGIIPHWFAVGLFGVLPILWVRRAWRGKAPGKRGSLRHRLLTTLTVASLVVCLGAIGVQVRDVIRWPWRYALADFEFGRDLGHRIYGLHLDEGTLAFAYYREAAWIPFPRLAEPLNGEEYDYSSLARQRFSHRFLGFVAARNAVVARDAQGRVCLGGTWFSFGLPYWFVAIMSAILPIRRGRQFHAHWRGRQRRQGRCDTCGYDLRASAERCPECGTPVPADLVREVGCAGPSISGAGPQFPGAE